MFCLCIALLQFCLVYRHCISLCIVCFMFGCQYWRNKLLINPHLPLPSPYIISGPLTAIGLFSRLRDGLYLWRSFFDCACPNSLQLYVITYVIRPYLWIVSGDFLRHSFCSLLSLSRHCSASGTFSEPLYKLHLTNFDITAFIRFSIAVKAS